MSTGGAEPTSFARHATAVPVARRLSSALSGEAPHGESVLARYQAYSGPTGVPPLPGARRAADTSSGPRSARGSFTFGRSATSATHLDRGMASPRVDLHTTFTVALRLPPSSVHRGSKLLLQMEPVSRGGSASDGMSGSAVAVRYMKERTEYLVDHAFAGDSDVANSQESVFDTLIDPLVAPVLRGTNACVLAYGATGTGKTHSVFGPRNDPGVALRLAERLCLELGIPTTASVGAGAATSASTFTSREASPARPARSLSLALSNGSFRGSVGMDEPSVDRVSTGHTPTPRLEVSFVELYCDRVIDLLFDAAGSPAGGVERAPELKVKELNGGFVLKNEHTGASETRVTAESLLDVRRVIHRGLAKRTQGTTHANARSSRGHALLTFHVKSDHAPNASLVRLVDLAGSEKHHKNLPETGFINQSLLALGQVIQHLAKRSSHVPFRDSVLTQLLRPVLGSRSATCVMLATADPTDGLNTRNTLTKAVNAKRVMVAEETLHPKKRSQAEMISALHEENRALRLQLQEAESVRQARGAGASLIPMQPRGAAIRDHQEHRVDGAGANAGHEVELSAMGPADAFDADDADDDDEDYDDETPQNLSVQPTHRFVDDMPEAGSAMSASLATPRHREPGAASLASSPMPRTPPAQRRLVGVADHTDANGQTVANGIRNGTTEASWEPDRFTASSTPVVPITARPADVLADLDDATSTEASTTPLASRVEPHEVPVGPYGFATESVTAFGGAELRQSVRDAAVGSDDPPAATATACISAVATAVSVAVECNQLEECLAPELVSGEAQTAALLTMDSGNDAPTRHHTSAATQATFAVEARNSGVQVAPNSICAAVGVSFEVATTATQATQPPKTFADASEHASIAPPAAAVADAEAWTGPHADPSPNVTTSAVATETELASVITTGTQAALQPPATHAAACQAHSAADTASIATATSQLCMPSSATQTPPAAATVTCGVAMQASPVTSAAATATAPVRQGDFGVQVDQPRNVSMQTSPVQTDPRTPERPPPPAMAFSPQQTLVALTPVQVRQFAAAAGSADESDDDDTKPTRLSTRGDAGAVAVVEVTWSHIAGAIAFALLLAAFASSPVSMGALDASEAADAGADGVVASTGFHADLNASFASAGPHALSSHDGQCTPEEQAAAEAVLFRDLSAEERGNASCMVFDTPHRTRRPDPPALETPANQVATRDRSSFATLLRWLFSMFRRA